MPLTPSRRADLLAADGTVLRRLVADVEAEIATAEKAQREAKREATKELVRARRERSKEHVLDERLVSSRLHSLRPARALSAVSMRRR